MTEYKDYGYPNDSAGHIADYIELPLISILKSDYKKVILDLGCGNGYFARKLLSLGFNVYGTDASQQGIAIAKRTYPDNFFIQDLSTGELPTELKPINFDTIISTEVIEHLYDPEGFIDFCKTILKGKGEIIISTPYHGYSKNLLLSLLNKWDAHLSPLWHGGHIKFWSKKTLSKLLTDKGFIITDFKGCGRVPYFWKSMIIKAKID